MQLLPPLPNRPATMPPRTRIYDFDCGDGVLARVSLRLVSDGNTSHISIDAQAFEVDEIGLPLWAPDGRPSRTPGTLHTLSASGIGDTHSISPAWTRIVGDYTRETFNQQATFAEGKPTVDGVNYGDQYFDELTGIGYVWNKGEALGIAEAKAEEMKRIVRNSPQISGLEF